MPKNISPTPWSFHIGEDYAEIYDANGNTIFMLHDATGDTDKEEANLRHMVAAPASLGILKMVCASDAVSMDKGEPLLSDELKRAICAVIGLAEGCDELAEEKDNG